MGGGVLFFFSKKTDKFNSVWMQTPVPVTMKFMYNTSVWSGAEVQSMITTTSCVMSITDRYELGLVRGREACAMRGVVIC